MVRSKLGLWLLLLAAGCSTEPPPEQIALGTPVEVRSVRSPEHLTDGRRPLHGAPWNARGVAFFRSANAHVVYDLGEVTPIGAAYLQGDNNDEFILEVSTDGTTYSPLWTAVAVGGNGLRPRRASKLQGEGRFVRVSARGGDAYVSLGELALYTKKPSRWPPRISLHFEMTRSLWARLALAVFALIAMMTALLHRNGTRGSKALWALTGISAAGVVYALVGAYPPATDVIDLARPVAGAVGAAVMLRIGFGAKRANQAALTMLLATMALFSVATFYNFGHPQFYDGEAHKPTYVHGWDLRVYFPAVKYFDELGYDGVYLASVKTYADEELGGSLDSIGDVEIRDLRDYEMRTVAELSDEIHGVKERFTPERWTSLQADMRYFWTSMGRRAYLDSLRDHGGNATPAWLLPAYWIYASADANEATFLWAALIDPLILLLLFGVMWRTFGLRAALVCMIAFGATTVYQFGSNWGGSTLRNDWMVLIGLGVCALKSRRWVLAGGLLGWGAMIRAFPALALLFLAAPIGWALWRAFRARQDGESPLGELLPLVKVGLGVLGVVLVLGTASSATFGFDESWGAWSRKISMHANRPNVNHLGLTALVSYDPDNLWNRLRARGEDPALWGPLTAQTMKDRRWLITLGMLFYTLLAIRACRDLRLSDAALIGTMMIPIYLYPSNYYLHVLFLWPLMLAAWPDGKRLQEWSLVSATVLLACAVDSVGWQIRGGYGRFLFSSGVLLVAIAVLLAIPIVGSRRAATSETA